MLYDNIQEKPMANKVEILNQNGVVSLIKNGMIVYLEISYAGNPSITSKLVSNDFASSTVIAPSFPA